eukprot:6203806-Pleurochrysis_carterae.AAC.1
MHHSQHPFNAPSPTVVIESASLEHMISEDCRNRFQTKCTQLHTRCVHGLFQDNEPSQNARCFSIIDAEQLHARDGGGVERCCKRVDIESISRVPDEPAGSLVEPPVSDDAALGAGEHLAHIVLDLLLALRVVPHAHLGDGTLEGPHPVARRRAQKVTVEALP